MTKSTDFLIEQERVTVTRAELKKEFTGTKMVRAMAKPFDGRSCLLCDKNFHKKAKPIKHASGIKKLTCSRCGLTHYNAVTFPLLLLTSPSDELRYRGLLTFQKQQLIYATDKELDNYNNGIDYIDYSPDNEIKKTGLNLKKTNIGQSPIYDGVL